MIVKLIVVQGRPAGKQLYFGPGEYYLGRGPECQVRFNTDWISRQHCLLRVGPDRVLLRDLSRNGTLVNGNLIAGDARLTDRDLVQIGPVVFQVEMGANVPAVPDEGSSAFYRDGEENNDSTEHQLDKTPPRPPSGE